MFFVISGYCIAASARSSIRNKTSASDFLLRRLRRIYAPYWCSIVVVALLPFLTELLSSLKTGTFQMPSAEQSINYGFLNFSLLEWFRLATLTQIFWPVDGATELSFKFTAINAVYWTLAIEVQFYLATAFILKFFRSYFYSAVFLLTMICLPVAVGNMLALTGLFLPWWPMFSLGILLYVVLERGWTPNSISQPLRVAVAIFMGLGASVFALTNTGSNHVSTGAFAAIFTAGLWLAKPLDDWLTAASRRSSVSLLLQPFMMLGTMSYSLYLLHGCLQFFTALFIRQIFPASSIAYDAGVIGVTTLLCWPFYHCFEAPFFRRPNVSTAAVRDSAAAAEITEATEAQCHKLNDSQTVPHVGSR